MVEVGKANQHYAQSPNQINQLLEDIIATALSFEEQKEPWVEHHFADDGEHRCEFIEGAFEHQCLNNFHVVNSVSDFEAEAEHCQTVGSHRQKLGGLKEEIRHEKPKKQSRLNQQSTPHKFRWFKARLLFVITHK